MAIIIKLTRCCCRKHDSASNDQPVIPALSRDPPSLPSEALLQSMAAAMPTRAEPMPAKTDDEMFAITANVLRAIVADPDSGARSASILFQDFTVRCRMAGIPRPPLELAEFTRRLSMARAGIFDACDDSRAPALEAALAARRHARAVPAGRPRRTRRCALPVG
jgi:hypothetical protein